MAAWKLTGVWAAAGRFTAGKANLQTNRKNKDSLRVALVTVQQDAERVPPVGLPFTYALTVTNSGGSTTSPAGTPVSRTASRSGRVFEEFPA